MPDSYKSQLRIEERATLIRLSLNGVKADAARLLAHLEFNSDEVQSTVDKTHEMTLHGQVTVGDRQKAVFALTTAKRCAENALEALPLSCAQYVLQPLALAALLDVTTAFAFVAQRLIAEAAGYCLGLQLGAVEAAPRLARIATARSGAEALHSKPGGSRSKREAIREIWATGKFDTRNACAEQECDALGMSYETARRALRNTPRPVSRS
jgi:hypothetical protein